MAAAKTKQITVTTMQLVLDSNRGNESVTSIELDVNRGTLRKMIADKRPNVVLVNADGSYTLLK